MLPRTRYEQTALIAPTTAGTHAIFLSDSYRFRAFECAGNPNFKGMLVSGVQIELDGESVFNPEDRDALAGNVIRRGNDLSIVAKLDGHQFPVWQELPILSDLPAVRDGMALGFRRWCITIGSGETRRELHWVEPEQSKP